MVRRYRGTRKNDRIQAGPKNDLLLGLQGNDFLSGNAGDDILDGGTGDDRLFGDRGNDTLISASGRDILTGGEGSDRFVIRPSRNHTATITDFEIGRDWIDSLQFRNLRIAQGKGQQKRDTVIRDRRTGAVLLILKNTNTRRINQTAFRPIAPTPTPAPAPTPTNTDPTLSAIARQTIDEDTTTGDIAFTIGDRETSVDRLIVTATSSNPALIPDSGLILSGTGANRTIAIAPLANQSGTATITLSVSDGTATTQKTFDVAVNAVNDAPVNTVLTAQTTPTNTALNFSAANGNGISIADLDAGTNPIRVTLTATNGTLTLANAIDLSFESGDGTADSSFTVIGTIEAINTALNGLQFDPTANSGTATVEITTDDRSQTSTSSDTDSIEITIDPLPQTEIRGRVWNDRNANGAAESEEAGLAGRTVFLDTNQNGLLDSGETSTLTDANGNYLFADLTAGSYTVAQVIPTNWAQTSPGFAGGAANVSLGQLAQRDHVFDPTRNILYFSRGLGLIERYRLDTEEWLPSIEVTPLPFVALDSLGAYAGGIDVTPDGNTLYMADEARSATQGFIRKIDLRTGTVSNLTYDLDRGESGAYDIAIASNGLAFLTSRFEGSGWVALRQIDLSTDTISVRTDARGSGFGGEVRQDTLIQRSGDRSSLFFTESNSSAGPIFNYSATSNTFLSQSTTSTFLGDSLSAVNRNGTLIALENGSNLQIRNFSDFRLVRTLTGLDGGVAFDPTKDVLYAINTSTDQVIAYNTSTWAELFRLPIGKTFPNLRQPLEAPCLLARTANFCRFMLLTNCEFWRCPDSMPRKRQR